MLLKTKGRGFKRQVSGTGFQVLGKTTSNEQTADGTQRASLLQVQQLAQFARLRAADGDFGLFAVVHADLV